MLSDINYDPFHDPGKVAQLRSAPAAKWAKILKSPDTPTQQADFERLQAACSVKGADTPYALLNSTLQAMHKLQPSPAFITVSGNIMASQSACRFKHLFPSATPADYSDFASKTVQFVAYSFWAAYRNIPIYMALGSSDSGCQDGREDPNSDFLQSASLRFAATTYTFGNRYAILTNAGKYGDYSVLLPSPMHKTRLIVMQNVFQSKTYRTCNGEAQPAGGSYTQNDWLHLQLAHAKANHEHVWIMAHLPPGVDTQSILAKAVDICTLPGEGRRPAPDMFLSTDFMANNLDQYSDIIKLTLFGRTQRDELRLIKPARGSAIPGKLLPALSPLAGNSPAFTLATINPRTGTMLDYTVIAATGDIPTVLKGQSPWAAEYTYSAIYHLPDVSGASLEKLSASLLDDHAGSSQASIDYQHYFFVSDPFGTPNPLADAQIASMKQSWPVYACSITESHAEGFRSCVCPAASAVTTAQQ
jgi:sphingomyelin phosphodiesterase acid-like 3